VKRYRFHREALDEYAAARQWYVDESKVARAFVDSVERAIRKIRRVPRAAARVPGQTSEEIRRHVLRRFPYTIVPSSIRTRSSSSRSHTCGGSQVTGPIA
jgi:hypothetical protein